MTTYRGACRAVKVWPKCRAAVKQTMQQGTVGSNWRDDLSGITDNV
jgi:hypothetical protein